MLPPVWRDRMGEVHGPRQLSGRHGRGKPGEDAGRGFSGKTLDVHALWLMSH